MAKAIALVLTILILAGIFALGLVLSTAFLALALNTVGDFGFSLRELVGLAATMNVFHGGVVAGVKRSAS